jgi:hypothetical protein
MAIRVIRAPDWSAAVTRIVVDMVRDFLFSLEPIREVLVW